MTRVRLQQTGFTYPGANAETISGLDLEVESGEAHALLGASGAGKTTLLSLLSGLIAPTRGRIHFNDTDVSNYGPRQRNVALVFQFPVLYESLSIQDNLMFPLLNQGTSRNDARRRAEAMARELEIDSALSRKPAGLPLYQKQLAAIGKALVRDDVGLVLLDEPLTAVEPAIKWRLRQTLKRVQRAHGITMIYVTHDQTEALTFADRVSIMADGHIIQTDTPVGIHDSPATEFVGHFVGSPGMDFVSARVADGRCHIAGARPLVVDLPDGEYTAGLRPDWVSAATESGPWQVEEARLLGTRNGKAWSLTRLCHDGERLHLRVTGAPPETTALSIDECMLFQNRKAVARATGTSS